MAEENVVSMEKELKKRQREEKFKKTANEAQKWVNDNKEVSLILITAGIAAVGFLGKGIIAITKSLIRNANLKKEEALKDLYCYDRSLGHYWKLKRQLTNDEWVSIEKRKRSGEKLADILSELKVLA